MGVPSSVLFFGTLCQKRKKYILRSSKENTKTRKETKLELRLRKYPRLPVPGNAQYRQGRRRPEPACRAMACFGRVVRGLLLVSGACQS